MICDSDSNKNSDIRIPLGGVGRRKHQEDGRVRSGPKEECDLFSAF